MEAHSIRLTQALGGLSHPPSAPEIVIPLVLSIREGLNRPRKRASRWQLRRGPTLL
jgi:hypothetical protein